MKHDLLPPDVIAMKGEIMNAAIQRITAELAGSPQEMALRIKRGMPTLADLNNEQLEQIARLVMTQRLTRELDTAVDLACIDWQEQRDTFLSDAKSPHTHRAYDSSLSKLEAWANLKGLNPLALTTIEADDFIRFLKAEDHSPATIRRDIAAVSAFYTWLERYHTAIKNPLRGTRIRPAKENKKERLFHPLPILRLLWTTFLPLNVRYWQP